METRIACKLLDLLHLLVGKLNAPFIQCDGLSSDGGIMCGMYSGKLRQTFAVGL
jgi:hypothetical protein